MNREDFPMLKKDIIYFDNGATTFKPKRVIKKVVDYYENYSANAHRGDYDISMQVDGEYESTREVVRKFINAKEKEEIIFTSGTTESINMIVFSFMRQYLNVGDEVLITKTEHASNVLPWFELEKEMGIVVKFIPLTKEHKVELNNLKSVVKKKTKVVSIAYVTNVIGDIRPIKEISKYLHDNNILLVVDGAQSVPHHKTDVIRDNIDFLAFSAHKMLGPTGVGVLYAKRKYLEQMKPFKYGGGMNSIFESNREIEYKDIPLKFEAGTQNIAGVLGLKEAINYLQKIGMDNIEEYEQSLRNYAIIKLKEIPNITIYNETSEAGIIAFNIDKIFAEDTSKYLNHHHICVRAGNHCSKMVKDEIVIKNTCRISLYFYNTKEEIDILIDDKLIEVLKNSQDIYDIIL